MSKASKRSSKVRPFRREVIVFCCASVIDVFRSNTKTLNVSTAPSLALKSAPVASAESPSLLGHHSVNWVTQACFWPRDLLSILIVTRHKKRGKQEWAFFFFRRLFGMKHVLLLLVDEQEDEAAIEPFRQIMKALPFFIPEVLLVLIEHVELYPACRWDLERLMSC